MSSIGSITHWLNLLKVKDPAGSQKLWERYWSRLVRLARSRLEGTPRRAADEEDLAQAAFDSFCRRAEEGRFPDVNDRHDLWQMLVQITIDKARDQMKHERRLKRGVGRVRAETELPPEAADSVAGLDRVADDEPTPAFAAQVAEQFRLRLAQLPDQELRQIAVWRMEGETTEDIAGKLGCVPRTVERKLKRIRSHWLKVTHT